MYNNLFQTDGRVQFFSFFSTLYQDYCHNYFPWDTVSQITKIGLFHGPAACIIIQSEGSETCVFQHLFKPLHAEISKFWNNLDNYDQ